MNRRGFMKFIGMAAPAAAAVAAGVKAEEAVQVKEVPKPVKETRVRKIPAVTEDDFWCATAMPYIDLHRTDNELFRQWIEDDARLHRDGQ